MNDEEAYDFHHEGDADRDLPYACREERAHVFRRHDVHEKPHRDRKSGEDHACHAGHIGISGGHADSSRETECGSFVCSC